MIPTDAPNPDAIYAWINNSLSAPTQIGLANRGAGATVNKAAVDKVDAANKELYGYTPGQIGSEKMPLGANGGAPLWDGAQRV